MKRLKWLSLYFHINYHCFYFKVSASVNSVNTTIFSEGEDAILFCDVSGVPPPVISWFNDKNENVYDGSLWKLPSVNRSYNGTYKCQASNGCGMDSKTFDIIVQCKSVGLWGTAHSLSFSVIDLFVVFRFGLKLKIVILGNAFLNNPWTGMSAVAWPVQFIVFFSIAVLFTDENRLHENEVVVRYMISVRYF